MWEPTLSIFCPVPITFYTCSWEVISTGWVAATRTGNYTLQEKVRRASFWRVGFIWFFGKHCWFQVEKNYHPSPPMTGSCIFSIFANSHSLLQRGQLLRVRSHFDMQSRWKTCPQLPQAMLRPSSDAEDGFAWYSMLGSCKLLRQIAQVSVQIDQDHTATAFHLFTSKFFLCVAMGKESLFSPVQTFASYIDPGQIFFCFRNTNF